MKFKIIVISLLFSFVFSISCFATANNLLAPMAASGSTQLVVIMNNLSNPTAPDATKTNIMVKYYDGAGNHPPCWTENNIGYHNNPNIAGAGGKNACGKLGTLPPAIVRIDILPIKASAYVLYKDLIGVDIDPNKFYTSIIVEQDTAPVFNQDGTLKTQGTIKVKRMD
ncbi:MAG: hypothetical protein KIT56_07200 [Gammaproteobacteria bacterium]|nr:hypothetical protein [Gammaproteobacteria bacterium]MCW5583650.1 hypothetical protein [Gammaproteobacteria bacterium]